MKRIHLFLIAAVFAGLLGMATVAASSPPVILGPGATMVVCWDGSKPQVLDRWLPLMLYCPEKGEE